MGYVTWTRKSPSSPLPCWVVPRISCCEALAQGGKPVKASPKSSWTAPATLWSHFPFQPCCATRQQRGIQSNEQLTAQVH